MKIIRKAGDTSNILQIFIQDSSSTTGAGLAALTSASAGLTAYYHKDVDTTATAISLVTMTVGTFTSSGFKEIDATNMPGWYQFCPPDAALSSGKTVGFHLKGATNMAPLAIECQLVSVDLQDAVAFGLSRIDGTITSRMATYTQPTGFLSATFPSGTIANQTNITAGTITTVTTVTNQLTAAAIATGVWQDTTAGDFTTALSVGKSLMNGVALGTGLTVNDITTKTGYSLSSSQTFNVTGNITGNLSGSVGSVTGAVGSVTGAVGSVTGAVGSITGNVGGNVTGSVGSVVGAVGSVTGAVGSVTGNVGGNVVGSVASVTARVTANTDQVNGNATAASNVANSMQAIARGTCSGGTTTTAVVSSMTSPASLTAAGQLIGRTILFDANTTTAALQGQASNITNSTTGSTPTITFTAMTTAPASTDTFSVL